LQFKFHAVGLFVIPLYAYLIYYMSFVTLLIKINVKKTQYTRAHVKINGNKSQYKTINMKF